MHLSELLSPLWIANTPVLSAQVLAARAQPSSARSLAEPVTAGVCELLLLQGPLGHLCSARFGRGRFRKISPYSST